MIGLELRERTVPRLFAGALARGGARPFLTTPRHVYDYGAAEEAVAALAGGLSARGVAHGTRVAVLMSDGPAYVWLLLALARLGAVAVTLNSASNERMLVYFLGDSACELGVVDADHADVFAAAARQAGCPPETLAAGDDGWIERIAGRAAPLAADDRARFSDTFAVLYTSGSTGMPKGVPVSHAQLVTTGAIFARTLGLGPQDRLYTCLPFFHINATAYTLAGALVCGGSIALGPRFSARRFWSDVAASGATEVNAMGSMLKILETREPHPAEREHGARSMFVAPLPVDAAALADRFALDFATTYAQTEWLPSSLSAPGEGYGRAGGAGPVLPYSEVRIVDGDDVPLPPGARGEIALRAHEPHVTFAGYLGHPQATVDAFRNLRFHTGDLGEIGDDGWLYFRGRLKDVIRRRGENISAAMVEELLGAHEAIAEVAAVPVPSSVMEEDVFVYVVPREGAELSLAAVRDFAADALPRYMRPEYARITGELPRTATNKVAKQELLEDARRALASGDVRALGRSDRACRTPHD